MNGQYTVGDVVQGKKSMKKWIFAAVGLVLVAAIAVLVIMLLGNPGGSSGGDGDGERSSANGERGDSEANGGVSGDIADEQLPYDPDSPEVNPDYRNEADSKAITYETPGNALYPGEYQAERSAFGEDSAALCLMSSVNDYSTRGAFVDSVRTLKARLDAMAVPYAFGYYGSEGECVAIRMDLKYLGAPVVNMCISNNRNATDDRGLFYVCSATKELMLYDIGALNYELSGGQWQINVTLGEKDTQALADYRQQNPDTQLYFSINRGIVFADLTEQLSGDVLQFTGIDCISSKENQADYGFLLDMMKACLEERLENSFAYQGIYHEDSVEYNLYDADGKILGVNSVEDSNSELLGVQYITAHDEQVNAAIQAVYPGVKLYRSLNSESKAGVYINVYPEGTQNREGIGTDMADEEIIRIELARVEHIYSLAGFDSGAYSRITFNGMRPTPPVVFVKGEDGAMTWPDSNSVGNWDNYAEIVMEREFFVEHAGEKLRQRWEEMGLPA